MEINHANIFYVRDIKLEEEKEKEYKEIIWIS